ncbi:MAG: ATP-dependent helicase HrpB [Alteromonadaceae bacterium]|nr:ATP-dependent helicase HrpB [Alteromonadaceae bacterium]
MSQDLPVLEVLDVICEHLNKNTNVVLSAAPGAGKSTLVPITLLQQNWLSGQRIIMLQPRRIAAKSIAHYLSQQLNEPVGKTIGYRVKNDHKVSRETRLEIVTEAILTRHIQTDPELSGVGLIIFDEFHERSQHADLGLMMALEVQQGLRDDLRLLVMSASMNESLLENFLPDSVLIKSEGRQFPVQEHYLKAPPARLEESVFKGVELAINKQQAGHLLIFLPGQNEINRCLDHVQGKLREHSQFECLPLYGALSLSQQQKVLGESEIGKRKIIFATNIAETSLTIPGVTAVVDSGLEKRAVFDPASGMTRLQRQWIPKSSVIQRQGRAGRTAPGVAVRLWTLADEHAMRDFQTPEVQDADLCQFVLELSAWGVTDFDSVTWISPPHSAHLSQALSVLCELSLLDAQRRITKKGKRALQMPIHPRLASMLLDNTAHFNVSLVAALLAERDVLPSADSCNVGLRFDYVRTKLNQPKQPYLVNQIEQSAKGIAKHLDASLKPQAVADTQLGKWLMSAFPDRLAKRRGASSHRYLMANGRGVALHVGDPLTQFEYIVVADCDAQKKEGRVFSAAPLSDDAVMSIVMPKTEHHVLLELDAEKQHMRFFEVRKFQAIELSKKLLVDVSDQDKHAAFVEYIKQRGLSSLNWSNACRQWLARANWLGEHAPDFPQLKEAILASEFDAWLFPYTGLLTSFDVLKKIDVFNLVQQVLTYEQQVTLQQEAPTHYQTPTGRDVKIDYSSAQGPLVSLPLQEVFGELASPRLAFGKVPLRFELLSPARRPLQTTSDLGGFWQSSYHDIAKEMRGRYPKHRWPEEPLKEKAGHSLKSKAKG